MFTAGAVSPLTAITHGSAFSHADHHVRGYDRAFSDGVFRAGVPQKWRFVRAPLFENMELLTILFGWVVSGRVGTTAEV